MLEDYISGGIWKPTSVSESPDVSLVRWFVIEANREPKTRHFVGYNTREREGRVSSTIVSFDKETMKGVTRSGRVYSLFGDGGSDPDARYVLGRWLEINDIHDYRILDESEL